MTHNGLPEKICVCGGGSLGIVCASVFLAQGISVSLLTGHPGSWHKDISVSDPDGKIYAGRLSCISSDPEVALRGAEMVLLCLPGYLIEDTLRSIKPWLAAERVARRASWIRLRISFISVSVAAPTLITAMPPDSFAKRSRMTSSS